MREVPLPRQRPAAAGAVDSDRVIRGKRARGFLVSQKSAAAPLLLALFDGRVLHVVRKGYSAQDQPGERYDVYVIDYGASGATPGTVRDLHAR